MDNELEQANTENTDTQTVEQNVDGVELTDGSSEKVDTSKEVAPTKEDTDAKSLKDFLKENPKYQDDFNNIVKSRLDRESKKYQTKLAKYENIEKVLNAGLGTQDIDESETKLREFYEQQGIKMPDKSIEGLTNRDYELLGKADAEEIIESGDAEEEANRLANKGYDKMNDREKTTFTTLAEYLTKEKKKQSLKAIGASTDILNSKEFNEFASKFNNSTDIKDIYDLYSKVSNKTQPKVEKIGSMKSTEADNTVKDYYSFEESLKFTKEDFDKNPKLFAAVEKSMPKW